MENQSYPASKHSLIYGVYISVVLIIFTLVLYVLDLHTAKWPAFIGYAVMLGGVIYASITYRDKRLGGFATYGQCFSSGFLAGLFAAIIVGIFTYIYMTLLGESFAADQLAVAEETMIEDNPELTDEQIEMGLSIAKNMMKPWWLSIISMVSYIFFALIFALISSIFIKKENPEFANN